VTNNEAAVFSVYSNVSNSQARKIERGKNRPNKPSSPSGSGPKLPILLATPIHDSFTSRSAVCRCTRSWRLELCMLAPRHTAHYSCPGRLALSCVAPAHRSSTPAACRLLWIFDRGGFGGGGGAGHGHGCGRGEAEGEREGVIGLSQDLQIYRFLSSWNVGFWCLI
jgi:hypothetical protein